MDPLDDNSEKLEKLLAEWMHQHEPSSAHLARLQAKIFDKSQTNGNERGHAPSHAAASKWPRSASVVAALASCALAIAWLWWSPKTDPVPLALSPPIESRLPSEHLAPLLSEFDLLFQKDLAWVAETNRQISIGIDAPSTNEKQRIVARVLVLRRPHGSSSWQAVWTGDVVSRPEELVEFASSVVIARMSLWAHVLPDGAVSLDTRLEMEGNNATWSSSSVQRSQVPQQVLSARVEGDEFQVWQTAAMFPERLL